MATTQTYQVTKSKIELYKFRADSGLYWADITIDAHGRGGRISIASDWGSWQNYWGAAGDDFKDFLGRISWDYAADKFEVARHVDVDETIKNWKQQLLEHRREGSIESEDARNVYDELVELEGIPQAQFIYAVKDGSYIESYMYKYHDCPDVSYMHDPAFKAFWDAIWPVMLAEFAREKRLQTAVEA